MNSVGDLPLSVMRYRVDAGCLTIDKLGVLTEYRNRNIAHIMVLSVLKQHNQLTKIAVFTPLNSWITTKLRTLQFVIKQQTPSQEPIVWGSCLVEVLELSFSSPSHLCEFVSFLQTKPLK